MSRELPMPFCTEMVQAIIEGRKNITRRIKFSGEVGDTIWVRETYAHRTPLYSGKNCGTENYVYKADGFFARPWKSGRFMPRIAARLFLEVTGLRAEPLQDISEADAEREGMKKQGAHVYDLPYTFRKGFCFKWDELNAKRGYPWLENPLVTVVEFKRINA
ncbi:hypothetical protein [Treponema endosymbiont of Eucomonympha sp.]|uniref:hypothetical protein n=1 Tax=Treponema endosymbiont of Eucomonympha sp. TaxID=1580831 RepID=UPI0007803281|nr:hypothetical protein [Treponema endosymbiont of Eucomonympha sp.]